MIFITLAIVAAWSAMTAGAVIASVGKERKPLTAQTALIAFCIQMALMSMSLLSLRELM